MPVCRILRYIRIMFMCECNVNHHHCSMHIKHIIVNDRHSHVRWSHSHHSILARIRYADTICQIHITPPPKVAWSPRDIQLCLRTIVRDDSAFGGHILASGPENTRVYKAPYQYEPQMLSTQCALWQSKFGFWSDWHQHQMCTLIGPTVALLTLTTV